MPTDKGLMLWGYMDTGRIVVTDDEGNPIRIETVNFRSHGAQPKE